MFKKQLELEMDIGDEGDIGLIAIHSTIEAYLLAYKFNQHFSTQFVNVTELNINNETIPTFNRFTWKDPLEENPWELIANLSVVEEDMKNENLLFALPIKNTTHLIPSLTEVDYFLKLPLSSFSENLIKTIQQLNEIQLAYPIEDPKIKLNPNLIFE